MTPPGSDALVSVVVPAFNAAATLAGTLRSALAQSHRNLEILVVDDGSHDATAAIAHELAATDHRVRVIEQANAGVAAARNVALAAAAGAFVAPLDADDLWHPAKIARQLARLASVPDAVMVYCWSADIDAQDIVRERRLDVARFEGDVLAAMLVANFIDSSSVPLIRRAALLAVGGWDEGLRAARAQGCEDWMLYLRLAAAGPVLLEPAFLVGYRQMEGAMSRDGAQMRRSMHAVHRTAERLFDSVPRWLLRQSRAQFAHYLADTLQDEGQSVVALRHRIVAIANDPHWLYSRTARRRLRGWIRRRPAYPPVGGGTLPFAELEPDVTAFPPPDRWTRQRQARLAAAKLASATHR